MKKRTANLLNRNLFYLISIGIILNACFDSGDNTFNPLWLQGHWIQEGDGNTTHEMWDTKSSEWHGHGFIIHQSDTVWEEKMKIHWFDSVWTLTIVTPGNDDSVNFQIQEWNDSSFVATNVEHDFPQKIVYYTVGNKLKATVSGNDREIKYDFLKPSD